MGVFLTCFDKVTRVMSEKGLDVGLHVLTELKSYLVLLESTHQEATRRVRVLSKH